MSSAPSGPSGPGSAPVLRRVPRAAWFPFGLVIAFVCLTLARLNGSSMALAAPGGHVDAVPIVGIPRQYRWDEFMLSSPTQLANVAKGFPSHAWYGLSDIDLHVATLDAPVADWTALFSPQSWGYLAVGRAGTNGLEIGFAWHWWFLIISGLVGTYALLMVLRPRPLAAATLATLIGLAPYVAWWSGTTAGFILGFLCGGGAALAMAWRAKRTRATVLWTLCAAWLTSCAVLELYLPWLLSLGLVIALVLVGWSIDHRVPLRRAIAVGAGWFAAVGSVVVVWGAANREALSAVASTYYPGNRVSAAGEGRWADLLSAPANLYLAFDAGALSTAPGAEGNANNVSEASSVWLPVPVLVLVVVLVGVSAWHRLQARRVSPDASRSLGEHAEGSSVARSGWEGSALGAAAGMLVLLAWATVPLPDVVGTGLLGRIPGFRTYFAIGLAAVVLLHVAAQRIPLAGRPLWIWGGSAVAATAAVSAVTTRMLLAPPGTGVVLSAAVAAIVALLVVRFVFVPEAYVPAACGLLVVAVASFVIVGPINRGIEPLSGSPLATYLAGMRATDPESGWATLDSRAQPVLTASGLTTVSGMTDYPQADVWQRLAPTQKDVWNNYNEYFWVQDPGASPVTLVPSGRHGVVTLHIDLCSPDVDFLGIHYVVTSTQHPAALPCYDQVATIDDLGTTLTVWRAR